MYNPCNILVGDHFYPHLKMRKWKPTEVKLLAHNLTAIKCLSWNSFSGALAGDRLQACLLSKSLGQKAGGTSNCCCLSLLRQERFSSSGWWAEDRDELCLLRSSCFVSFPKSFWDAFSSLWATCVAASKLLPASRPLGGRVVVVYVGCGS